MPLKQSVLTTDDLVDQGVLTEVLARKVTALVHANKKGLITGRPGSGKTTLLQALLPHIPGDRKLVLFEGSRQLQRVPLHAVRLESVADRSTLAADIILFC